MHFSFEALSSFDRINLGSRFLQAVVTLCSPVSDWEVPGNSIARDAGVVEAMAASRRTFAVYLPVLERTPNMKPDDARSGRSRPRPMELVAVGLPDSRNPREATARTE